MRHTRFTKLGAALAIVAGGAVAAVGPSLPALAFVSGPLFLDIEAQTPARLVAGGAAVDVVVEVTCTAVEPASVSVRLTQTVPGGLAQGSGSTFVGCTGRHQQIVVRVTASAQGQAFRPRQAVADSFIFGCHTNFCGDEQDSTVIRVRR